MSLYNPFLSDPEIDPTDLANRFGSYNIAQNQSPEMAPMGMPVTPGMQTRPSGMSRMSMGATNPQEMDLSQLIMPRQVPRYPGHFGTELHPGGFRGALQNMMYALANYNGGSGSIGDQIAGGARAAIGGRLQQHAIGQEEFDRTRQQALQAWQVQHMTNQERVQEEHYRVQERLWQAQAEKALRDNPYQHIWEREYRDPTSGEMMSEPWGITREGDAQRLPGAPSSVVAQRSGVMAEFENFKREQNAALAAAGKPVMTPDEEMAFFGQYNQARYTGRRGVGGGSTSKDEAAYSKALYTNLNSEKFRSQFEWDDQGNQRDPAEVDQLITDHTQQRWAASHPKSSGGKTRLSADKVADAIGKLADSVSRDKAGPSLANPRHLLPEQTVPLGDQYKALKKRLHPNTYSILTNRIQAAKASENDSPAERAAAIKEFIRQANMQAASEEHQLAAQGISAQDKQKQDKEAESILNQF